ncbi:hypothetical protein [Hamadaea tsunoensis]|uniref:hypothetical protein n=1 Tax=Hamadaea tsunoensis TaxID=53368 RepID=UPI00040F5ECD|nr:hypothetical protein [Hamadaea tsunoensis]
MTGNNDDKLLYDPQLYHHLPPEDRPSTFIADYKDIAVNVDDLESFSKSLMDELTKNYLPHRDKVATDLAVGDIYTNQNFVELIDAMKRHAEIRQLTLNRLFDHGDGTDTMAVAADKISKNYGSSDAYSSATSRDVTKVIDNSTTSTDPKVNTNTTYSPNGAVTAPATTTTVTVPTSTTTSNPDNGTDVTG